MKEKSFCDKHDFKTGYSSYSGNHMEEKHEGVKYYCDNCDVQKGNLSYLKVHKHKQVKHESRLYSCEKCNCKTKWRADFRKHVKNKHEILFLHEGKREGEAFKSKIDDKLDNVEEHADENDNMSDENAENTGARNAIEEKEMEIDGAYDVTKVNDEENEKTSKMIPKKYILMKVMRKPK